MSVPMDLNFMDFLLTKSDQIDDKYFTLKQEQDVTSNSNNLMEDGISWAGADDFLDGIFSLDGVDPALDILDLPTVDPSEDLSLPLVQPQSSLDEFFDQKIESADHASGASDGATSDSGLCSDVDIIENHASPELAMLDEEEEISPAYSPAVSSPGPSVSEVGMVFSPEHSSSVITSSSSADSDDMCSSVNEGSNEKRNKIKNVQQPRIINLQTQRHQQQYSRKNLGVTKSATHNTYSNNVNANNQTSIRKVIRLSPVNSGNNSNPRSILLPVTIKDMKDLRTIKIINASGLKKTSAGIKLAAANLLQQGKQGLLKSNVVLTQQQLGLDDSYSEKGCNSDDSVLYDDYNEEEGETAYPRLVLTPEEQRLLVKEGITLPTSYPLTKHEERELKRIRRKIRNKISAQDSRKRKKEYVDGLEDRVKQCTEENQSLMKRIKVLQNQNQSLATQLRKLHSMLAKGTNKTTQPATCLMVLLLSMALIAVPSLRPGGTSVASQQELAAQQQAEQQANQDIMASSRRSLLYTNKQGYMEEPVDDEINMEDLLTFHSDHDYPIMMKRSGKQEGSILNGPRKRALMDLPVDDTWPPPKMKKYDKYEDYGNQENGILYDTPDVKSEVEYDYYYTDLEPDDGVNIYEPLEGMEEIPISNPVYTIGGKIGELLDVGGQVSVNNKIVDDLEKIASNAKNKSEINGKSSKVVMQVTEQ